MYTGEKSHIRHIYRRSPGVSQAGIRQGGTYTGEVAALTRDVYRENIPHVYRRSSALRTDLYREKAELAIDKWDADRRSAHIRYVYRENRSHPYMAQTVRHL